MLGGGASVTRGALARLQGPGGKARWGDALARWVSLQTPHVQRPVTSFVLRKVSEHFT